jgi:tetratricopeptide (TPR) repeat protein
MKSEKSPVIPEFMMYEDGLEASEHNELINRFASIAKSAKHRFMVFTDTLIEYVGSGEYKNRSNSFLSMLAKSCYLRGMYGFNQILARGTKCLTCKGYAAAAYCRQNMDPRWINNLRNYVHQAWQAQNYIVFSELSGELASILIDLGYVESAREVAADSIDKVTQATSKVSDIRTKVQAALLRSRIILAYIFAESMSREESLIRLDSAEETAKVLDHQLANSDVIYYRARALDQFHEYDRALDLVRDALREYERMGYLYGVAKARNLRGAIYIEIGQLLEARDQFEEVLVLQQRLNNQIGLADALINVGEVDRALGQLDQMETYNLRALELSQEVEYVKGIAISKLNLGDIHIRKGEVNKAIDLYREVSEISKGAGLLELHVLAHFQMGDSYFMSQKLDDAMKMYKHAVELSEKYGYPLSAFNAKASEIITSWAANKLPESELLNMSKEFIGPKSDWIESEDASLMKILRQKVYDDSTIESDVCVFYDCEKNFVCRIERTTLGKECIGNLFWTGSLCPYFKEFIDKLNE